MKFSYSTLLLAVASLGLDNVHTRPLLRTSLSRIDQSSEIWARAAAIPAIHVAAAGPPKGRPVSGRPQVHTAPKGPNGNPQEPKSPVSPLPDEGPDTTTRACKGTPGGCGQKDPDAKWRNPDGIQVPLRLLKGPKHMPEREGMWSEAQDNGRISREKSDNVMLSGKDRIDASEHARRLKSFNDNYEVDVAPEPGLSAKESANIAEPLAQAGIPGVDPRKDILKIVVRPEVKLASTEVDNPNSRLLEFGVSAKGRFLTTLILFSQVDGTARGQKLRPSDLHYFAMLHEKVPNEFKAVISDLAAWQQHEVINIESQNTAALAIEKYPDLIDPRSIPPGRKKKQKAPRSAGHAYIPRDHPAFDAMFSMPNMKASINWGQDYHTRVEKPWVIGIDVDLAVDKYTENARFEDYRPASIVPRFGPVPRGA